MKRFPFLLIISLFISTACQKNDITSPKTSVCIEAKVEVMRTNNMSNTSVKRYAKDNEYFWLFDTGAAFDAPKYMLNISCDTVCRWCRCTFNTACYSDFNLNDSTVVTIWKP